MDRLIRNLHILWRAESLLLSLRLQRASKSGALWICAGMAGLLGVAMLNVAGFVALQPGMGTVTAALLVAGADFLIAVLAAVAARAVQADPRLVGQAMETRQAALEELGAELAAMQAEIKGIREDFASMRSTVTSFIHRPFDSPVLAMILPLLKSITRSTGK